MIDVDNYERAIELAGELSGNLGEQRTITGMAVFDLEFAAPPTVAQVTEDGVELRQLVPRVLSVLVGRGADSARTPSKRRSSERSPAWGDEVPADPTGWLFTVAWRAFLDMTRSDATRRDRELRFGTEPPAGTIPSADDTLRLYFLSARPDLTSSSAVALTLRAVGGLTTRQDKLAGLPRARAHHGAAHRRAKRTVGRAGVDRPGDVRTVMRCCTSSSTRATPATSIWQPRRYG